jgi:hypothetical protein
MTLERMGHHFVTDGSPVHVVGKVERLFAVVLAELRIHVN